MSDALARLQQYRNLVLACEITGFIHDLGKLSPGFAEEMLTTVAQSDTQKEQDEEARKPFNSWHGAIVEPDKAMPAGYALDTPGIRDMAAKLLHHPEWAKLMKLPDAWGDVPIPQTTGLAAPLRQHHADEILDNHAWLGDLYMYGADIRDSALDKGSSGVREGTGEQTASAAFIANAFGADGPDYRQENLAKLWGSLPSVLDECLFKQRAWENVYQAREKAYRKIGELFKQALGETRRPTNDVTLWHHAYSTASLFKAAMTECVLRGSIGNLQSPLGHKEAGHLAIEKSGLIRFRLLGVRWDWRELTRGALTPVVLTSLALARKEAIVQLRQLLEDAYPVGNLLYEDDDGALFALSGYYEGDSPEQLQTSENRFRHELLEPLAGRIGDCVLKLGAGTPFRLCWSEPTLYLTDYPEALGKVSSERQIHMQAGEAELRELWQQTQTGRSWQICPQCGMRPAEALAQEPSQRKGQTLCETCKDLSDSDAKRERSQKAAELFGYRPKTFEIEKLTDAKNNSRVLLVSVQMDMDAIASGRALITQLARPVAQLNVKDKLGLKSANTLGDKFEELLKQLAANQADGLSKNQIKKFREKVDADLLAQALGDRFWLTGSDGREQGNALQKGYRLAQSFFLRQTRETYLPKDWKLYRHDGDRLALFAQRKHPSPARLQRLWDDLRGLWRELLGEVGGIAGGQLIPLSLDARGLRFLVSAADGTAVMNHVQALLAEKLGKLRGGLAPHVSCLAFGKKFPLYIALDAVYRMEGRIVRTPHQTWELKAITPPSTGNTDELSSEVPSPHGGGLGWGRDGTVELPTSMLASKLLTCPPPNLPPMGGGVNSTALKAYRLYWQTPQGRVTWDMDMSTGDPDKHDLWHPHLIRSHLADGTEVQGPDRLTHVRELKAGDRCLIPPATFDFLALEAGTRRYQIVYEPQDGQLHRPHLVFGDLGKPVGLLEQFNDMASLVRSTGWKTSQLKALHGEMVELYEKWVRDVPETLRDSGRKAWETHLNAMLGRYMPGKEQAPERAAVLEAILNGRFFDAVEWSSFITGDFEKNQDKLRSSKQEEETCD